MEYGSWSADRASTAGCFPTAAAAPTAGCLRAPRPDRALQRWALRYSHPGREATSYRGYPAVRRAHRVVETIARRVRRRTPPRHFQARAGGRNAHIGLDGTPVLRAILHTRRVAGLEQQTDRLEGG